MNHLAARERFLVLYPEQDRLANPQSCWNWFDSKSRTIQRGQRYDATVTDFQRQGNPVATLVEVDRLGHAWIGGAPKLAYSDVLRPDASRLVWAFVAKQFR